MLVKNTELVKIKQSVSRWKKNKHTKTAINENIVDHINIIQRLTYGFLMVINYYPDFSTCETKLTAKHFFG